MNLTPLSGSSPAVDVARTLQVRFAATASVGIPIQHRAALLPTMIHDFDESTFFRIASLLNLSALRRIAEQTASSEEVTGATKMTPTKKAPKGRRGSTKKSARELPQSSPDDHKITSFRFTAPQAQQVQLVGDFTGWEKHPVDLVKTDTGEWATVLLLKPGQYSYDFIVDGARRSGMPPRKQSNRSSGAQDLVIKVVRKTV